MKFIKVLSTAILILLPGAVASANAQGHEQEKQPAKQQQEAKPAQQQPKRAATPQQAKPAQQSQRAATPQQAKPAQQSQRAATPQQAKPAQQPQRAATPQQANRAQQSQRAAIPQQANRAQQPQRAATPQQANRAQQPQRAATPQQANRAQPAAAHGRIPDDRFRASFGSGHTFHVNRSEFAGGSRRFEYGGFWFSMINPWPAAWLYTDNVYIDYMNGGYFLCDPVHPGVYLSINIG
jgi:cytoskeletal protein RodZ